MKLSRKYAENSASLQNIVRYLTDESGNPNENAARLDVSAEEVAEIAALQSAFAAAYAAYTNPDTHNEISVANMRAADGRAFAAISPLRLRLKHGRAALTSADYAELGIHEDKKTRTRTKAPQDVPHAVLIESKPLSLTFEAVKQTPEGAHRFALPPRWKIAREVAIVAAGTEPADGDFRSLESAGRGRFAISFDAAQVGMHCYLRIAFENSAGRSPFSLPVKAIVI